MASISVVQYNTSPHKMNVLQQNNGGNSVTDRREIIILSKNVNDNKQDILITNPARKKLKAGRESTRVQNPPPIAVARRNARERNRVKQVNNGFATLRQHIPNSIAAAYESSSGRGGNKKLSKVETLRMAVEYIRTLEDLLAASDDSENSYVSSSSISLSSYPSPTPSSPTVSAQANLRYNVTGTSPIADDDDLSTNPTPPPHHYVRITNSNYQILPLYETNENLEPLDDNLLTDTHLIEFSTDQDLSMFNTMDSNGSLSPDIYSDHSLSPPLLDRNKFISVFNNRIITEPLVDEIKFRIVPPEQHHNELNIQQQEQNNSVLNIQQETIVQKNNVMEVISWWDEQPPQQAQQQIQHPVSTTGS